MAKGSNVIYCNHRFDFCRGLHPYVSKLRAEEVHVLPTRFTSWVSRYDLYSSVKEFKAIFSIKLLTSCYSFKDCFRCSSFHFKRLFPPECKLFFSSKVRNVFTLRRTAWFAGNSTIPNEYGSRFSANHRLTSHRSHPYFYLHAQPPNQE